MSACAEHTLDVVLYLDDELKGEELKDFVAHLAGCAACRLWLDEERKLLDVLHRFQPLYIASDLLLARVSAARRVSVFAHIRDRPS